MHKSICYKILLLLFIIIENSANNIHKELSKYPHNPSYFIQKLRSPDVIQNNFAINNTLMEGERSDISVTPYVKKPNVNRVSRKQYEVINMLWRKTKIFVDIETSTVTYQPSHIIKSYSTVHRNPFQISLSRPLAQISTPSYIEFYYIHEIDDRVKQKKSPNFNIDIRIAAKSGIRNNTEFRTNKLFNNHYKETLVTPHPQSSHNKVKLKESTNFMYYVDFFTHTISTLPFNKSKSSDKHHKDKVSTLDMLFRFETCPFTTLQNEINSDIKGISANPVGYNRHYPKSQPYHQVKSPKENQITNEKILLKHMDQNTGHEHNMSHHKTKHSKKNIDNLVGAKIINDIQNKHIKTYSKLTSMLFNGKMNDIRESSNVSHSHELNAENLKASDNYVNSYASWSEYRFVAVYVYEPLQVHCDATGISPHWLITAGSCLARHHKNPGGEGLSAYVTYCGDNWWNPERISYVKYSLVHPRYHPRNMIRRHLYNIGIIQVVNSMVSACPGWSPVSLMSHHFPGSSIAPRATAIGWGLDRFDARYTVTDVPKRSLMIYNACVYSDSCPGNIGYSKAKLLKDEGGVNNVYCLSLPPYKGEENDPVHGSLLLVGEKLIALYLQEERRPWGEQCALYTGTWRLVPWVLDNARESDESDIFTVDI